MADYTLADLAALTGIPARTIRYYIAQGLVPAPGREGPATRYPAATLDRLRLIARLRDVHQPLASIRATLAGLGDDEVRDLAGDGGAQAQPAPESALEYVRALLGEAAPEGAAGSGSAAGPGGARGGRPAFFLRTLAPESSWLAASDLDASRTALPLEELDREPSGSGPAPSPAAQVATGDRSQWERIAITADIEIHVRRPLSRRDNRVVERLLAFARQLLGEEPA